MPVPFILLYILFVQRKELCEDQFSPLIVRVSVIHAGGTPGGYVEGFVEKRFSL